MVKTLKANPIGAGVKPMENCQHLLTMHDEIGHTRHHPDSVLFGITKNGLVPPHAPANYRSDMPAWGSTLKDSDIWAVLAFIKSRWSTKARKVQEEVNARADG